MQTYSLGRPRSQLAHIAGSTSLFMGAVNTLVAGTLGALVAYAADAPVAMRVGVGTASALAYLGVFLEIGRRSFGSASFPSPPPDTSVAGTADPHAAQWANIPRTPSSVSW